MDRTSDSEYLSVLSVLADIRRRSGQTPNEEPNSLMDMLLAPDFIPRDLTSDGDVRDDDSTRYEDLPPLEDDEGQRSSRPSSPPPPSSAPLLEDDAPPLESDEEEDLSVPDPVQYVPQHPLPTHVAPASSDPRPLTAESLALLDDLRSVGAGPLAHEDSPPTPRPPRATTMERELGAESDSSLPDLQSVSDSSEESDDESSMPSMAAVSDSSDEWDDEEDSLDDSDHDSNSHRASADSHVPRVVPLAQPTFHPFFGLRTSRDSDPGSTFRTLLERARGIIPDFEVQLRNLPGRMAVDNDPQRAETLLASMEVVSEDFVRRYEKLRMGDGGDGGVDGCAICRDNFFDKLSDASNTGSALEVSATSSFHAQIPGDVILAFPCSGKHLFHRDCLFPWMSRKTTCPTCRFDIDPLSLTLRLFGGAGDTAPSDEEPSRSRLWRPPQVESFGEWLLAEEHARETFTSRERPQVVMPEYPSLPIVSSGPLPSALLAVPSMSELLDTTPDWGFDSETGHFDEVTASHGIQRMRQHIQDVQAFRQHMEHLFTRGHAAADRPNVQHSTVPGVTSVQAAPSMPLEDASPAVPIAAIPSPQHVAGSPPSHPQHPPSLGLSAPEALLQEALTAALGHGRHIAESVRRLRNAPLVRGAPRDVDMAPLTAATSLHPPQPPVEGSPSDHLGNEDILQSMRQIEDLVNHLESLARSHPLTSGAQRVEILHTAVETVIPPSDATAPGGPAATPRVTTAPEAGSGTLRGAEDVPHLSDYNPADDLD